jgi:preprotein translocase subunit SecA
VIYQQRNELLETNDISETITAMRDGVLHDLFRIYVPVDSVEEQWDIPALELALESEFQLKLPVANGSRPSRASATTTSCSASSRPAPAPTPTRSRWSMRRPGMASSAT